MKIKSIGLSFIWFCIGFFLQAVVLADNAQEKVSVQRILIAKKTAGESRPEIKKSANSSESSAKKEKANGGQKYDESKRADNRSTKPKEHAENHRQGNGKNQTPTSSAVKKDSAPVDKQADKKTGKRKVAGEQAYNCSEFWTDEFSYGYVQVGSKCSSDSSFCFAFFHIHRNYCEGDNLIRHYCDPKQPSLVSTETIKCKKSCEFSGLSGTCVK